MGEAARLRAGREGARREVAVPVRRSPGKCMIRACLGRSKSLDLTTDQSKAERRAGDKCSLTPFFMLPLAHYLAS